MMDAEQIDERRSEDVVTVNICDTCEEPYQVNANFDQHDCGKAGAASVDRRAIVEEAFENLLDRFIGRDFYGYDDIADVMNEALAEMEANNENSKM